MQQFVFCDAHSLHVCPVSSPPPAVLHGLDLESEHCMFENQNGKVTLVPLGGAQCSVNGVQVTQPSQLNQGETSQTSSAASLQLRTVKVSLIIVVFRVVCSVFTSCRLCCGPGAVILLGRTNMFRFNHPKEAAKLREKRKVRLYLLRAETETMFPPSSQQLYLYFHCQKF